MSAGTCHISMSLDGFVAGPNQSLENPLGEGGMRLHQWAFATESWRAQHGGRGGERSADAEVVDEVTPDVGAFNFVTDGIDSALEHARAVASPAVTHVKYRVVR